MKVLVIAPHPDDEVLGVGGTIARHNAQGDSVTVCIVTKGQPPLFPKEGYKETRAEAARAHKCLGGGNSNNLYGFPGGECGSRPQI